LVAALAGVLSEDEQRFAGVASACASEPEAVEAMRVAAQDVRAKAGEFYGR
jgi:hypothetical protein